MSALVDDHCCWCGHKKDGYAVSEGIVQAMDLPGDIITNKDTRDGCLSTLLLTTFGEEGREEVHLEDNSSLASSYAESGTVQSSLLTSLLSDKDQKDDATKDESEQPQKSQLKQKEYIVQVQERHNTSSLSEEAAFEHKAKGNSTSDDISRDPDNFGSIFEPDFRNQKSGEATLSSIPSKIDHYLATFENQDIVAFPTYPGEHSFRLPSYRAKQPYMPRKRAKVADNRKHKRCCDECRKRKVECSGRETGRDCDECRKKKGVCGRSDEIASTLGSKSSSQKLNHKATIQEEPQISAFHTATDVTAFQPEPEMSAFDAVLAATDAALHDQGSDSQSTASLVISSQPPRFLPASIHSEPFRDLNLDTFLDDESNRITPTYSYQPITFAPGVSHNFATSNLDPSQNFDTYDFPSINDEYTIWHHMDAPQPEYNYHQDGIFNVPPLIEHMATPYPSLNDPLFEVTTSRTAQEEISFTPQQLPGTRNVLDSYNLRYNAYIDNPSYWHIEPSAQGHTQTTTFSPSGRHPLANETPGFTPSSDSTAMFSSDNIMTPLTEETLSSGDIKGKGKETMHSADQPFEEFIILDE